MTEYTMIKILKAIAIPLIVIISHSSARGGSNTPLPLNYPENTITTAKPFIIWQDMYTERDSNLNVRYRITLKAGKNRLDPVLCYPDIYYKNICVFQYPRKLNEGKYEYKIERLINKSPVKSKYFHYHKYPVKEEFTVDTDKESDIDRLPPEYLTKYLFIERHNRYINKYNSIFFGAAGATTMGIGIFFYRFFNYGLVSKVVSVLCFTSSAVGFSASGYYGYRYMKRNNELREIIKIGKDVSIKGGVSREKINADIELSF